MGNPDPGKPGHSANAAGLTLVIGAGISGISVAKNVRGECLVLEKEDVIGGLSTQYRSDGYWFDYGGHYFHFQDKGGIKRYLERYASFKEYRRKSKVFVLNRLVPFPLQFHLSYLPAAIKKAILKEILERQSRSSTDLYRHLENSFGPRLFRLFFYPFLSKYYRFDLHEMAAHMDKGSIPVPDQKSVRQGFSGKKFPGTGYNPLFYYPVGNLRRFFENYSRDVRDKVLLKEEVLEIDIDKKRVRTPGGYFYYRHLVNTMPLKNLLKIIKPAHLFPSHRALKHTSTLVANLVLTKKRRRFHWVYLPEKRFPFYRVGLYPGQRVPACYLERTVDPDDQRGGESGGFDDMATTLRALKLIDNREDIVHVDVKPIPISYIIFDREWQKVVPPVLERLRNRDIYSIGRYGAWNYTSMSDDVKSALETARLINRR